MKKHTDIVPTYLKNNLEYASGKVINGEVGYLSIPSFDNLYSEGMTLFTDSLQKMIRQFDQQNLIGWIVDLRDNNGGADMPKITGLGPLLDSSNVYYTVDEEGKEMARSYYKDGEDNATPIVQSNINYQLNNSNLPVAVLTSFKTASSAEAVTAIFAGQDNVKIIGNKTNGLTSTNSFNFLTDNSVLNIRLLYKSSTPNISSGNRSRPGSEVK